MTPTWVRENQRILACLWGGVIALSMMRVWSSLFFTPIYLMALLAIFDGKARHGLLSMAGRLFFLLVYFAVATCSLFWTDSPLLVAQALRADILIPCLAFSGSFYLARELDARGTAEALLLGAWGGFLIGSIIGYQIFRGLLFERLFDSIGYYSTYVFMLAGASVPFLNSRRRLLFYPLVAALLFFTQQRVAWVVFPFIGLADALYCRRHGSNSRVLLGAVIIAFVMSIGILKIVSEGKAVDGFNPEVRASSFLERLAKNERLAPWHEWVKRGFESPVIGHGFGRDNVKEHFSGGGDWPLSNLNHGHNILINNFLQLGLLGLTIYLAAQLQIARFLLRQGEPLAYAALCILLFFLLRNMFDDFSFKRLLIVYSLLLGWCMGGLKNCDDASA